MRTFAEAIDIPIPPSQSEAIKLSVGRVKAGENIYIKVINLNMTYVKTMTPRQTIMLALMAERLGDKVLTLPDSGNKQDDQVMIYSENVASDMGNQTTVAKITKKSTVKDI